jgi:hypothetical protein
VRRHPVPRPSANATSIARHSPAADIVAPMSFTT